MRFVDKVIGRLEEVVREETAALTRHTTADLEGYIAAKSHAALELSRALRGFDATTADQDTRERIGALRRQLDGNRALLDLHLRAVREIAQILTDAIRESESDGTYSPAIRIEGPRP